jgi:hydrogenase expression/formation protein HypE
MKNDTILLGHGSGGKLTHELITGLFMKYFGTKDSFPTDSAILKIPSENIAFTTDSYVVDPIFFPGGNIGKLAVCGTVNDLAVSGAKPLFITSSYILEEGFPFDKLEIIVKSMAEEAQKAGVKIVAGDTKVVNRGKCDKIFINTSGIGELPEKHKHISYGSHIKPGDKIIINGNVGDHGVTIIGARENIDFSNGLQSDCTSLNSLIASVLEGSDGVKFMRDATRGGVATVLCELVENKNYGIEVDEDQIPVSEEVFGLCEVFGFDPLYIANEGKVLMVADASEADKIVAIMQRHESGKNACIIGEVTEKHASKVVLNTEIGGSRIIDMHTGEQLPRIC